MDLPKRKSLRLQTYDYSMPGAYFITVCTHHRRHLFGEIIGGDMFHVPKMSLSAIGAIVDTEIQNIEKHYDTIKIDKYVIMPNHVHMIIRITARINPCPTTCHYDIPNVVGKWKAAVTRHVRKARGRFLKESIWQVSYNDHIIRSEEDYAEIWKYIDENPLKWTNDCFYSEIGL